MRFNKINGFGNILVAILVAIGIFISKIAFSGATTGEAFGAPGTCPNWSPSTLTFIGTAANPNSHVWFTGFNGIVSQVFYPSADKPSTVDWQFLIGDAAQTWVDEEKQDTTERVKLTDRNSLSWTIANTAKNGKYQIEKTIFTDPNRNTLIQQVTFTALQGTVGDFNLYTLYHPAIANEGRSTTGYTTIHDGMPLLVAKNSTTGQASALASSLPFQDGMISSGFVAKSDGWQDLKGDRADNKMDWIFESATEGNIAQMAMFDLSSYADQKSVTFNLVLGFGPSDRDALAAATDTLQDDFSSMLSAYNAQWNEYTQNLNTFEGAADAQYYTAAMALKAAQDKDSGAMVAGLGNPWGNSNYSICTPFGVEMSGGYHLVWPRDLYKFASAAIVAGDRETPEKALEWLFTYSQQPDGHFLQNAFADGTPYWKGVQMDQTAFPIVLAWKLDRTDAATYQKHIKPAADYLVKRGPWTEQERWEENSGYSPGTIAAEIAGLVCAAEIAGQNGDVTSQQRYLETADYWQGMVENWTFTTTGPLGDGQYYERIDDNGNPNDAHRLNISNQGGSYDERAIVDSSFLELVRHGVKSANNPYILASLPEIDATIAQMIPGKGFGWFRYNHDRYGETETGADYTGAGIGRLWPLLTGERGHFAIARGEKADAYLAALRSFANPGGMISEQVWDLNAPAGYTPGTPTKSMTPLSWAMGEYISLLASNQAGKVLDMPEIVYQRYVTNAYQPHEGQTVDYRAEDAQPGKALTIYYRGDLADASGVKLHWGYNDWQGVTDKPMIRRSDGFWETTIAVPVSGMRLNFAFTDGENWDNNSGKAWTIAIAVNK